MLKEILKLLYKLNSIPQLTFILITPDTYYNIMSDEDILKYLDVIQETLCGCKIIVTRHIDKPFVITEVASGQ